MPFIEVRVAGREIAARHVAAIQGGVTALMAGVLGKKAELTAVLVVQAAPGAWSIGGAPVPLAAHLEAKVTAGTNTVAEKARFVAEAHDLLVSVLGDGLPTATYVVVHEVAGDAWGYAGQTQASRAPAAAARMTAVGAEAAAGA